MNQPINAKRTLTKAYDALFFPFFELRPTKTGLYTYYANTLYKNRKGERERWMDQ